MILSDFYIVLAVGIVVSLLIHEFIGVSPGGMIVPAILASFLDNLDILLYILLLSLVTYFFVEKVLGRYMIIFGKKKFAVMMLVALLLKLLGDQLFPLLPFAVVALNGIGAIVPGLLASTYVEQGIKFTVASAIMAMFIVYFIMNLIYLI